MMQPAFHALVKREQPQDYLAAAELDRRTALPRPVPWPPTTWRRLQHRSAQSLQAVNT